MATTYNYRKHFKKVDSNGWGPKKQNPVYRVTAKDGTVYEVSRHLASQQVMACSLYPADERVEQRLVARFAQWSLPVASWAWSAKPLDAEGKRDHTKRVVYEDSLEFVALKLGLDEEA